MDGKFHFIAGGLAGIAVSKYVGVELTTAVSFTLLGGCVGLIPDLDVNGTLAKKISLNKKWLILLFGLIGLLLMTYSIGIGNVHYQWLGIVGGAAMLLLPPLVIKQKMMLLLTGIAIFIAGLYFHETWIIMLGIYISIASRLPHRSLTHSLIGLAYFSGIGYYLEQDLQIEGIMLVCTIGYASHLILDMKWIPTNRKGVKLFQPFSRIEL